MITVEEAIAREIVSALKLNLAETGGRALVAHRTENPAAHELYLKGRYFFALRTPDALTKAIASFDSVIAIDSSYALAYSGLADALLTGGGRESLTRREALARAKSAALTALAHDSALAEAYTTLGRVREVYDWDWAGAEQAFRRAIEIDPRYALGHSWYGLFLALQRSTTNQAADAVQETGLALTLDPLNGPYNVIHGYALMVGRRYRESLEYLRKAVELLPTWGQAHLNLGQAYLASGMYREAIIEFERTRQLSGRAPLAEVDGYLGNAYARAGNRAAALAVLKELRTREAEDGYWHGSALLYAGLGDRNTALAALEQAVQRRDFLFGPDVGAPAWDALRADPRFGRILKKVGLSS